MRGRDARLAYIVAGRQTKKELVKAAQCDTGFDGLMSIYQSRGFEELARIRNRFCATRFERLQRKADFFHVLARMADRQSRLPNLP